MCIHVTDVLEKWEAPPINQVSKELKRLQNLMKQQETAHNEFRCITQYVAMVLFELMQNDNDGSIK